MLMSSSITPASVAVPDEDLLTEGRSGVFNTRIRAGRLGLSYASHRIGFVHAGAPLEQRLTRPFLRYPSLIRWARSRAAIHDFTIQLSSAGPKTELLAKLLGSRQELVALLSGPLLPALQSFNRTGNTQTAFPDEHGCSVGGESYLAYEGICSLSAMDPLDKASRDKVDERSMRGSCTEA